MVITDRTLGFTLVELAIVLVIIGLLVGGVLVGQDLIKSAELYALNQDKEDIVAAVMTFRDKYGALPGDWMHATDTFGILTGTGSDTTCQNAPATGGATCNGNGDGRMLTSIVANDETFRAWQQLGAAGLIKGQYTGTGGLNSGYTYTNAVGVNLPPTHRSGVSFNMSWFSGTNGNSASFAYTSAHDMQFIYAPPNVAGGTYIFTSSDTSRLDTKFDDGAPATGGVFASKGTAAYPCTSAATIAPPGDVGATYNLTNGNPICYIVYMRVF